MSPPDDDAALKIGSGPSHIVLRPTRRSHPDRTDYWDGNWLAVSVEITAGAFRARFKSTLRSEELVDFRDQLRAAYADLSSPVTLRTLEDWIQIDAHADGRGHFFARCRVLDVPGTGNQLSFDLAFDQTDVAEMLHQLHALCDAFPILGSPR